MIATGSVTSQTQLSLSFKNSGPLAQLHVHVGDMVKAGQLLAELDQKEANVTLAQAQAALAQAQANYNKIIAGATQEDVHISNIAVETAQTNLDNAQRNYETNLNSAKTNLENAKSAYTSSVNVAKTTLDNAQKNYSTVQDQQDQLVANAYTQLQGSGLEATPNDTLSTATMTVTGTYTETDQGSIKVSFYDSGGNVIYVATGLVPYSSGILERGLPKPIGKGLSITVSTTGTFNSSSTWTIDVPNTRSSTYLLNYNAYKAAKQTRTQALAQAQNTIDSAQAAYTQTVTQSQSAIDSAQAALSQTQVQGQNAVASAKNALEQAQANLALKIAKSRPQDVESAQAQIQTAQAQVVAAQNITDNNTIIAPIDGQITAVNPKLGEQVMALKEAIVLLNKDNLRVESFIPESSIGSVLPGKSVEMTFDAFGQDKRLIGTVISVDPASVVVSGVIEFKVISTLPQDPDIKPGMTTNLTIVIDQKENTLAVPNRLIKTVNNTKTVAIVRNGKTAEVPIETGLIGDAYVEVTKGLTTGDTLTTPSNQ